MMRTSSSRLAASACVCLIALSAGCTTTTPAATPAGVQTAAPTKISTASPSHTPDQAATEDAARFAATIQAYQTETAAQKATERAGGSALLPLAADNLDQISLLEHFETDGILAAEFTADGQYAVLLTGTDTWVVDLSRNTTAGVIPGDAIGRISFGPEGRFAAAPQGGSLLLFNPDSEAVTVDALQDNPTIAAYSPDGSWMIVGTDNGGIAMVDSLTGSLARLLTPEDFSAGSSATFPLGFSPDGGTAAVFFYNVSGLWVGDAGSVASGSPSGQLIPWLDHAGPIADVRISPDWQHLAWISRGTMQIMTIAGSPVGDPLSSDIIRNPVFLPDGDTLVYTANRAIINQAAAGSIRAVDLNTGILRYELNESDRVAVLVISPDGLRAAAGFDSGEVMLFDPESGDMINRTGPAGSPVIGLAFSPSGSLLAVLRNDGSVEIGPAGSGFAFSQPDTRVFGIGFDQTGSRLAVVLETGEIRFYGARP